MYNKNITYTSDKCKNNSSLIWYLLLNRTTQWRLLLALLQPKKRMLTECSYIIEIGRYNLIDIYLPYPNYEETLFGFADHIIWISRLIKAYLKVGIQTQATSQARGVIGIIEADFLQPTHNKQDFDHTATYR